MRHRPLVVTLAAVALGSTASAEVVLVPLGSSLKAAVAAAQPGDTLVLAAGEYVDSGMLAIDKSLTLIGAGSSSTTYTVVTPFPFTAPLPLAIHDIDASEEVRVFGLRLVPQPSPGLPASVLAVFDCDGPVALADVVGTSAFGSASTGVLAHAVLIQNAQQLSIAGCTFNAGAGPFGSAPMTGTTAVLVEGSNVSITASTLRGGPGAAQFQFPEAAGATGGPAVHAIDSSLRIGRSSLIGGAGKTGLLGLPTPGQAGDGAPAVVAENSELLMRGGPENALVGGAGSVGVAGGQDDFGAGASAALLDANSLLTLTTDAAFAAGADGGGNTTAPAFAGAGTVTPVLQRLATIRTTPLVATLGGASTTELAGEPFGIGVTGFSIGQSPALALPGILGALVLDLGAFQTLPPFALGATGAATQTTPLPSTPSLAGISLMSQGLVVSPLGVLSLSAPVAQAFVL